MVNRELADQTGALIADVQSAVNLWSTSKRIFVKGVELPREKSIMAARFLLTVNGSPYFGASELNFNLEAAFDVATYLTWNRDKAVKHFDGFLKALTIDARVLKAWVDNKLAST